MLKLSCGLGMTLVPITIVCDFEVARVDGGTVGPDDSLSFRWDWFVENWNLICRQRGETFVFARKLGGCVSAFALRSPQRPMQLFTALVCVVLRVGFLRAPLVGL